MWRRQLVLSALVIAAGEALGLPAWSETKPVKIGILSDMSGPLADASGPGSLAAAKLAVEDFGGQVAGTTIEIVSADHQNKPDLGSAIAGRWFDVDGVDVIADMVGSPVGFAVQGVARARNKVLLLSGSTSSEFTGKACSPTTIQWALDTYGLAIGAATAMSKLGAKSWFFLTVDQAYGHALSRDTQAQVLKAGGTIAGTVTFPANNGDFGPLLLQAHASGADVLALASSSGDTMTAIKQAGEFGLASSMRIVALQSVLTDIHGIGLATAQGMYETSPFYWDRTPATRAFAQRFYQATHAMPSGYQASVYSSVHSYLAAVQQTGTVETSAVMQQLRATPVDDVFGAGGQVRVDGKMVHDLYLLQVKTPQESSGPWDLYKVIATLPAETITRPLAESECPLVKPRL